MIALTHCESAKVVDKFGASVNGFLLDDLQHEEGKTILMVEQNAKRGLEFADIDYVMVSGNIAIAGSGDELLGNPDVGRLFPGG